MKSGWSGKGQEDDACLNLNYLKEEPSSAAQDVTDLRRWRPPPVGNLLRREGRKRFQVSSVVDIIIPDGV